MEDQPLSTTRIVGLNGSLSASSKTRRLLQHVIELISGSRPVSAEIIDVATHGPELGGLRSREQSSPVLEAAFRAFESADLLLVASPTYKGSYGGLFKHFIDFIDYRSLVGRPVGLLATGGSDRHALVVEHQLRPLFAFFVAHTLPTAVFVSERDMVDGTIADPLLNQRIGQLVEEARLSLPPVARAA
jgi:FMN reductase